jgi:hypothetical protein
MIGILLLIYFTLICVAQVEHEGEDALYKYSVEANAAEVTSFIG